MNSIYVGDSKNVFTRINKKHCTGNVKVSAFRRSVAETMNFPVVSEPTISRNGKKYDKVYINLPNRKQAEKQISDYLGRGAWKFLACDSAEEARDFQYYAIEKICPKLNKSHPKWNAKNEVKYKMLLDQLLRCDWLERTDKRITTGPGVYLHGNSDAI